MILMSRVVITRRSTTGFNPTPVQLDILRRTAMGFTTWPGMFGSGAGIGMAPIRVARSLILAGWLLARSASCAAAVGAATRAAAGRRIAITVVTRWIRTSSTDSAPFFPQVSKQKQPERSRRDEAE